MRAFAYAAPRTIDEARRLVRDDPQARFHAGGTTLVDLIKADVERPSIVVDVSRLPLDAIELRADRLRIGALVRNTDAAYDATVAARFPALAQALLAGASGQIRNAATIGGNLLQRTRCPYFRETRWRCNKRDLGSGCDALGGYNRMHAVLGTSDRCIAAYPGDMAIALAALDARVVVHGDGGERTLAVEELFRVPGDRPDIETTLAHGELVVAVEIPFAPVAERSQFFKLRDRASFAFALVSLACGLAVTDGRIVAARLALGGLATVPWRARDAEALLTGETPSDALFRRAADVAFAGARPRAHNGFKIELARRLILRALRRASGDAR
ncbi:MAG: xanthine dehydrogenase family protein subunit M [Candidatus Eremiobacteraeota bacterium]|nr:xanthine dehydrogenase family protein subunit M [Candidatus Eremiobacteraeota bacterium]